MLRRALSTSSTDSDISLPLSSPPSFDTQCSSREFSCNAFKSSPMKQNRFSLGHGNIKSGRNRGDGNGRVVSWRMFSVVMMVATVGYKLKHDSLHSHFENHRQTMTESHERVTSELNDLMGVKKNIEHDFHRNKDTLKVYERRSEDIFKAKVSLSKEKKALALELHQARNRTEAIVIEYEYRLRQMDQKLELLKEQRKNGEKSTQDENSIISLNDTLQKRQEAMKNNLIVLHKRIQRESHREVVERFGTGPHHVEFKVKLPTEHVVKKFIVEMASVELMPHTVHLFLEQVHHGLWDGCSFIINDIHVLQGSPLPAEGKEDKFTPFVESELDILAFQEYSDDYPHVKYTLGFNGRPGGSHFYINMMDNAVNHGPGGQYHHELEEEADPCFGRIVGGKDVIDEISALPTKSKNRFLVDRVMIYSAKIVQYTSA